MFFSGKKGKEKKERKGETKRRITVIEMFTFLKLISRCRTVCVCVCVRACVRACVCRWVGGWVGV